MKFFNISNIIIIAILLLLHLSQEKDKKYLTKENKVKKAKRSIVLIKSRIEVPFITDSDETKQSTGFIINKEKGLILTSKKTARMSPAFIKVQFHDGSISNGKVIYSDPFLPFGIIQVDINSNNLKNFNELPLGKTTDRVSFYPSANVLLMCLADDENYVIKRGKIVNTNRNYQIKYGSLFQTNIDRVKGLYGCPIIGENGKVIGIHYFASLTTSYELRIDYINNVLPHILNKTTVKRGDIGISISLLIFGVAKINYKLNEKISEEIAPILESTGGPPEIMVISSVYPSSNAIGKLKSGDIIYKVNDKIIGNNFLLLEEILNDNIGKNITVVVSRNSKIISLVIKVENAENQKVKKYISFSGAYFHEINHFVSDYLYTKLKGLYLTYAKNGSPFSKISQPNVFNKLIQNNKNNYILTSINSQRILNLDDFINYFKNNCENESIYVEGMDFNVFSGTLSAEAIDLDFSSSMLEVFNYNETTLKFDSQSIDLKEHCRKSKKLNITIHNNTNINSTHLEHFLNSNSENLIKINNNSNDLKAESSKLNVTSVFNNSFLAINNHFPSNNSVNQSSSSWKKIDLNDITIPSVHHEILIANDMHNDYKKKFFFKQENLLNDFNSMSNDYGSGNIKMKESSNVRDSSVDKILFIEDKVNKSKDKVKKVNRKFLDHLTGLHRFHI